MLPERRSRVVSGPNAEPVATSREDPHARPMDALSLFGLFAVSAMLLCYAFERRSHWFVLGFAAACGLGSAYGFLQGAWPFGLVEAVWSVVALQRWVTTNRL